MSLRSRLPAPVRSALGQLRRRLGDGQSAPAEWHLGDEPAPTMAITPVADLALIQGLRRADDDSGDVLIELDGGSSRELSIDRWFADPRQPGSTQVAFVVTADSVTLAGAHRARLRSRTQVGPWLDLPELTTPKGMPGVEAIERCPACSDSEMVEAGRRQGLTMRRCGSCGLMMTSPRPAEDKTLVRYSRSYFEGEYLDSQVDTPELRAHNDALLDAVDARRRPGAGLFELGVGGGLFLDRAAARGWQTSGTDVNPAAVEHVAKRDHDVWVDNIDHAVDIGGPYSAIVSEMSLEHVRRPDHAVQTAATALEPGGVLLVYTVCPDGQSLRHAGMASYLVGPAEHLFLFSEEALVALCERAGLEVERTWTSASGDDIGIVAAKPSTKGV